MTTELVELADLLAQGCCMTSGEVEQRLRAIASRAAVPDGFVLVPREPTDAMLDAGRFAVMARDCSGAKWSPRQHYEASGQSMVGIPDDELAGYHSIIPKEQGATLVWFAMLAAAATQTNGETK